MKGIAIAAGAVGALYVGSSVLGGLVHSIGTHRPGGSGRTGSCPAQVTPADPVNGRFDLVAAYRTSAHDVLVCRTATGRYYYHGEVTGDRNSAIDLPATRTSTGFIARNRSYTYEIRNRRIIVRHDGVVLGTYAGHPFTP
ncbi:hypothetical protein [Actinomadura parmotrematis]|uniref:Uncharacterized protein n=1 Tax=Actinomadura parmotrematis TaxID=2864039 RepID=A0ABS7G058_9ACTN|nr:hypothetical protein [Actinomadura parmotrematis]MBW8485941.1 hypothetical protein [Actinomadura parmotrematis]